MNNNANNPPSPMNNNANNPPSPVNNNANTNQSNTLILNLTLDQKVDTVNTHVSNQQGQSADGSEVTESKMTTTDPNAAPQITEDLMGKVESTYYNNETDIATSTVLDEIKLYAGKIQCSDFHGKGTIDDYTGLFQAASRIANETKQMQLDVDVDGFNDFGKAADDLSALFNSFIVKLQNVSIIDDSSFLQSVADALKKIYNLSEVFGKFKETIVITSDIRIPKSLQETKNILTEVMDELNCAMGYIGNFVVRDANLPAGQLSAKDKNIIQKAADTIDNWNILCEHGVTIALTNSTDIQAIKNMNSELKTKSQNLQNVTNILRARLQNLNL